MRTAWALVACALSPLPSTAQSAPLALEVPGSARAAALGGAYFLADALPDVLFVHPAGIAEARGVAASFIDFGPNARAYQAAGALEWWGGAVAVGVQSLSYGSDTDDPGRLPPLQSALGVDAPTPVGEQVLSVGYARPLGGVDFGAAVRLVDMRLAAGRSGAARLDLGAGSELGPVRVAVSVQNLGGALELPGGSLDADPRVGATAASPLPSAGPLDFAAAASFYRLGDGEVDAGGGLEVRYWPITGRTFAGRIGYRHVTEDADTQGLTVGFGFFGDDVRLDWAWEAGGAAGAIHRFGIGWR